MLNELSNNEQERKRNMKTVLGIIGGLLLLAVVAFVVRGVAYGNYAFWAPKEEALRRDVFENTNSYNRGKIQELVKYRVEWLRAEPGDSRDSIEHVIRMQFADYPAKRIEDLQLSNFLTRIKGGN